MLKIKHLMDRPEADDGTRLWIEPIGLCRDMIEWCEVAHVLSHIGPPLGLWRWFEAHPDGYDYFRAKYHEHLQASKYLPALAQLARVSTREDITLLHQGSDPAHNTAVALHEFLSELSAYQASE